MSAPGSSSPSANFTSAAPPFDADAMEQTLLYQLTLQRSAAIRSHQQRSTNETNKRQTKRKRQNSDSAATSCSVLENPIVLIEESHPLRSRLAPVCARHPFFERVALPLSLGLPVVVNSSAEHFVSSYQDTQRLARLLRSAAPVVHDASRQSRFLDWSVAPLRLPTTTTVVAPSSAAEHGDSADDSASSKSVVGTAFTVAKEQLNESLRRYLTDAWMWHRKQHHDDNGPKSAPSAEQEGSLNHDDDAQSTRNIVALLAGFTGDSTSMPCNSNATSQYLEEAARFLAKALLNAASNASRRHDVPRAVWECERPEGRCCDDKGASNEVSSSAGGGEATAVSLSSCSIWDGLEQFQSAATAPSDDVLRNHEPHAGTKQRASSALLQPHEVGAVVPAVPNKKRRRNHHEPVASGTPSSSPSSLHDVMSEANSLRLLMSLVSELRAEEYITEENPIHFNDIVAAAGAHPWFVKVRNALANTPCLESSTDSLTGDIRKPMDDVTSNEPLLTLRIELQDVLLRL